MKVSVNSLLKLQVNDIFTDSDKSKIVINKKKTLFLVSGVSF